VAAAATASRKTRRGQLVGVDVAGPVAVKNLEDDRQSLAAIAMKDSVDSRHKLVNG
jgi:hypothetical protein